jgi:DNA (cytosine-5)-methyltransferase 1
MHIEAIDLFCGAGGLSYGLKQAGIIVKGGVDFDRHCKFPFEENIKGEFILGDIKTVTGKTLEKMYSKDAIRLLAGCAPCQPFSTLAAGKDTSEDAKWSLLDEFARLVLELKPELVSMENVPRVANHRPFHDFIDTLKSEGYHIDWKRVRCADYGVPQVRRRFVLIASKLGEIKIPASTEKEKTVRDAISHLPKLGAGGSSSDDPLHKARSLNEINLRRIEASLPGGTWLDWPPELRAKCHISESGASYKSVYARMSWDKPSPTITTQCVNFGTGRFGHPEQNRAITLREAAILQSFPDDYKFVPTGDEPKFSIVGRLIGNAVPPKLGTMVGETFISHIEKLRIENGGSEISD